MAGVGDERRNREVSGVRQRSRHTGSNTQRHLVSLFPTVGAAVLDVECEDTARGREQDLRRVFSAGRAGVSRVRAALEPSESSATGEGDARGWHGGDAKEVR